MSFRSVYSRVDAGTLLHTVADALRSAEGRADLSPPDEPLQVSIVLMGPGKQVQPHIHSPRDQSAPGATITQESWLVLRGRIRVRLFDLDRTLLEEEDLSAGCLLVTYYGGHSLECLEKDTVMLELKNGPYLGRDFETFSNDCPARYHSEPFAVPGFGPGMSARRRSAGFALRACTSTQASLTLR